MSEFKFWVIIVTLMIFLMFVLSLGLVYVDKKIKKADAILLRLEEKEKKREKPRVDPVPDDDGLQ